MVSRLVRNVCTSAALVLSMVGLGVNFVAASLSDISGADKEVQVLAHGPIHEAFAEIAPYDPQPGIIVVKSPPPPIEEMPPDEKPDGDVQWIPGYWAWADERKDFIWVSGVWRVPPPGRRWVPGYWAEAAQGFQWTSGYWAANEEKETPYLPEPPESVEVGPSSTSPSPEHGWIPGCWIWANSRYAWKPGYWVVMRPDRVWVPDHYVWTPYGYVFVEGYWDYDVIYRGVLFAPVYFSPRVLVGMGYLFSPRCVISLGVFSDCLFLRPSYCHYYFGDYYAPMHYSGGIYPLFSVHVKNFCYDSIFAHQKWKHRNDPAWEGHLAARFQDRRIHEEKRPPRQPLPGRGYLQSVRAPEPKRQDVVKPLDLANKGKDNPFRSQPLNAEGRGKYQQCDKNVRTYRKGHEIRENQAFDKPAGKSPKISGSRKVGVSQPVVRSKPSHSFEPKKSATACYRVRKPNLEPSSKMGKATRLRKEVQTGSTPPTRKSEARRVRTVKGSKRVAANWRSAGGVQHTAGN